MLVKHLRTKVLTDFGCDENLVLHPTYRTVPYATIVAVDTGRIGFAICNAKDNFSKKMGIRIAEGRALAMTEPEIPNYDVEYKGEMVPLCEVINAEYCLMRERAKKYFRGVVVCY